MKPLTYTIFAYVAITMLLPTQAQALSCLPIEAYLEDVVGKEEVVIFTGTSKDRVDETEYTAEVLTVDSVKQGYVEKEVFVYHEKNRDWGYLCNNGPKEKGTKGLYVGMRNDSGSYQIYQRLELDDPLVKGLESDLKDHGDTGVTGEVVEFSKTDRMNQIVTTITDLLKQIGVLLKEYAYWKGE